jgi:effector-binding domain-containing protein
MASTSYEIEEKDVAPVLVAGVRIKGKYGDCGKGFAQIGRRLGRYIRGKPFLIHFDKEYHENDADFEACMPVKSGNSDNEISVRELPGGHCVSLIHRGPYNELGRAYAKVAQYIHDKGYEVQAHPREIYLKGPGMLFKGNPKNYLTELQFFVSAKTANLESSS